MTQKYVLLSFNYQKGKPKVTVKLKYKEKSKYFSFLVDSGSDYTLISQSDAVTLGIDYKEINAPEIKIEIADLTTMHTKKVPLTLLIDTFELNIPVLIAKEPVERLLGRKGVFPKFDITFKERLEEIEFKYYQEV